MAAIDVDGLTKHYGDIVGIDDVSFRVEEGEIFGYLGPNGAGKTTTIRILLGLLAPTAGGATVLGHDTTDEAELIAAKRRIGYLPDNLGFDENVTGGRILDYHAAIKGEERRDELLGLFRPPLERKVREYSHGNRRMLGIVQTFMHDPRLVIMDEPSAGLDPIKKERLHQFLRAESERGTTVFFSSHVLSEVRRICNRVGILRGGSLVALEEVETLIERGGKQVHVQFGDEVTAGDLDLAGVVDPIQEGELWQFTYTGDYNALLDLIASFEILDIDIHEPSLEDVFMHYYGDGDGDGRTEGVVGDA